MLILEDSYYLLQRFRHLGLYQSFQQGLQVTAFAVIIVSCNEVNRAGALQSIRTCCETQVNNKTRVSRLLSKINHLDLAQVAHDKRMTSDNSSEELEALRQVSVVNRTLGVARTYNKTLRSTPRFNATCSRRRRDPTVELVASASTVCIESATSSRRLPTDLVEKSQNWTC